MTTRPASPRLPDGAAFPLAGTDRVRVVGRSIVAAANRLSMSYVLAPLRALHIDNRPRGSKSRAYHNDAQDHDPTSTPLSRYATYQP